MIMKGEVVGNQKTQKVNTLECISGDNLRQEALCLANGKGLQSGGGRWTNAVFPAMVYLLTPG